MNEIINKLLFAQNEVTPEMHLRQPRFTYSAHGPFTKNKERVEKLKKNRRHEINLSKRTS